MDKETFKQKLEELLLESGFGHAEALDDTLSGTRSYNYISDELEMTVILYEDLPENSEYTVVVRDDE